MESKLSKSQLHRIKQIKAALDEVYEQSLDEWIDGFEKDWRAETELKLWESLSMAYTAFTQSQDCSDQKKDEALNCLMSLSLGRNVSDVISKGHEHMNEGELRALATHFEDAVEVTHAYRPEVKDPDRVTPAEALRIARVAIRGMLDAHLCYEAPVDLYEFDPDADYLFALHGLAIENRAQGTRYIKVSKSTGEVGDEGIVEE